MCKIREAFAGLGNKAKYAFIKNLNHAKTFEEQMDSGDTSKTRRYKNCHAIITQALWINNNNSQVRLQIAAFKTTHYLKTMERGTFSQLTKVLKLRISEQAMWKIYSLALRRKFGVLKLLSNVRTV